MKTLSWSLVVGLLFSIWNEVATHSRLIQTLEDEVGTENFTYYRLQRTGILQLELVSLHGDVDVYVSSEVQHPDYSNYELKSDTCGVETVLIPSSMPRPVYIALFGHPNYLHSKYRMSVFEVDETPVDDYEALVDKYERYYYEEMDGSSSTEDKDSERRPGSSSDSSNSDRPIEDDLPLWWKILLGILEFSIEDDSPDYQISAFVEVTAGAAQVGFVIAVLGNFKL